MSGPYHEKLDTASANQGARFLRIPDQKEIMNLIQRLKRAKCSYLQLCSDMKTINISLFETTEIYMLSGQPVVTDFFLQNTCALIFARENNIFLINLQFCQMNLEVLFPSMVLVSL